MKESKEQILARLFAEISELQIDKISAALEFRRDQYGLSTSEFAAVLGISNTRYSEIKNCKRDLPIGALRRAIAIGVPHTTLIGQRPVNN